MIISSVVQVLFDYKWLYMKYCCEKPGKRGWILFCSTVCENILFQHFCPPNTYIFIGLGQRTVFHKYHAGGNKNPAETTSFLSSCVAKFFETKRRGDFFFFFWRCRKSDVDTRPCDIDPDGGIGQVPTQGQQPALMTIDNNLSLFDFQPNSLLEKRREWLPLDCQWLKWSGKGLITCPGSGLPKNPLENSYRTTARRSTWKSLLHS